MLQCLFAARYVQKIVPKWPVLGRTLPYQRTSLRDTGCLAVRLTWTRISVLSLSQLCDLEYSTYLNLSLPKLSDIKGANNMTVSGCWLMVGT